MRVSRSAGDGHDDGGVLLHDGVDPGLHGHGRGGRSRRDDDRGGRRHDVLAPRRPARGQVDREVGARRGRRRDHEGRRHALGHVVVFGLDGDRWRGVVGDDGALQRGERRIGPTRSRSRRGAGSRGRRRRRRRRPDGETGRVLRPQRVPGALGQRHRDRLRGGGRRVGIVVLGLPLGQGELGLLGVQVGHGAGVVPRRGQDLLQLDDVVALVARDERPEEGQVAGLGDGVAPVDGEHGVPGVGGAAVRRIDGVDQTLAGRVDVADLLAGERAAQCHRVLQGAFLHPAEDHHIVLTARPAAPGRGVGDPTRGQ